MILRVVVILLWSVAGMADVPTNLEPLSQRLEQLRQQHGVAGVSVLLVDPNQVLLDQQLGVTDWPSRIPFTAQHLYRIGSISKTFAGLLALRLQAKGLIDLDVSIQDYGVDQVENAHPNPITLTQLLEHTAGLKDLAKAEWDHNQPLSLQAAFALKLAAHRTHWPPGQHKSYSNLGAGLFGLALELKLKDSYENLLQQHVLTPLGMQRTNMLLNDEVKNSLIAGYDRDGTTPIPYWHVIYRPAAAINTNNQDMSHFLRLFLNRGQVGDTAFLHPDQMRRMQQATTTLAAQAGLRVGYGLGLSHWQVRGHDFWGHFTTASIPKIQLPMLPQHL